MALTRARYSQIFDTDYKQSVRLATTTDVGNLLISGNVVSTVDGVTVSVNDRILVKDQTDAKQNGIYRVVTVGSGTDGTWVRAQDADNVGNGKVTSGMTTTVTEGSTNASKTFKLSTPDPIVVGTTELTFVNPFAASVGGANTAVQFNDAGSIGGSTAFVFNKYSNVLTISGNVSAGNILTSNILYPNGSPYLIGGGTVSISSSNTAPISPTVGDFWYDTSEDILFQYIDDGTNQVWIDLSGDPAQVVTGTPNKQFYANKVQVGTSQYLLDTFPAAGNTLVTWTVSAKDNIGNNIRSSTIHSVNDGTDVYWTEYGIIQSNSSVNVATFTSNISSGNIRLYTTGDSANVSITFQRLLLGSDTTTGYIMGGTAGPAGPTGTVSNTSGIIKTTNTTVSTSATTGALQVAGGAGIGGNVYIQSGHQFNIGADLANLTLTGNLLTIDLSPMHVFSDADANNRIIVQNVNSGSNASSGMTFVADNGDITNNFLDIGINNSTNDDGLLYRNDGFLHVIGGNIMVGALSLTKNIHFHVGDMTTEDHMVGMFDANSFHVMKSTVSTSTTTGALRVHGGAGIEGNVYAGNITATYLYGNGSQLTGITGGSADATKIESGTSNVKTYSSSNVTVSVAGTSNVAVFTGTNIEIAGNLIPSANVTYNLGSSTRRWNVGYFAANTIDLGGSTIGADTNGFVMTPAGGSAMSFNSNGSMTGTLLTAAQPNITQVGQLANLTVGGNLTVSGNLTVNGNVTTINANNLTINDSLIYLAEENPDDTLDIGITAHVVNPSLNHVGLVRDASDGIWKLFSNVSTQPTTTVDFTNARYANLQIGNLIASSIVLTSSITTGSSTATSIIGGLTLSNGTFYRNGGETVIYGGGGQNTRAQLRLGNSQGTVLYGRGTAAAPNLPNAGIIIHGGDGNVQIRAPNTASTFSEVSIQATTVNIQGNLNPTANLTYTLGNVTNLWNTVFANTVQASGNISTAGIIFANSTATSTSTTSGALRVAGGVGVAGNINTGGQVAAATLNATNGIIATWTTGTRPSSPVSGQMGYNTTLNVMEVYNGTAWVAVGGLNIQSVQTSGFTAVAGNIYPCNTTSAAFTVTLPASPAAGNQIQIIDYAGTFATNKITLARNGSNIIGDANNYILATNRQSTILTYIDSIQGWVVSSAAYTISPLTPTVYTASYLIAAGGGGGGNGSAGNDGNGGGGAGGLLTGTASLIIGTTYNVTVGAGGAGGAVGPNTGVNGSNSTGLGFTAIGGGGGGTETGAVGSGGSGGGASCSGSYAGTRAGGTGTAGQGNNGGGAIAGGGPGGGGGGGGGSAAVGATGQGSSTVGGAGGAGTANSITGSSLYYAAGGGGSSWTSNGGAGGIGGGGGGGSRPASAGAGGGSALNNGSAGSGASGGAAGANTGSGGGAGVSGGSAGQGGSGVVILSVPTANYSGVTTGSPSITTSGSNTIIRFNSSGSYTA